MKSILVAVNLVASSSFDFKKAVSESIKNICPNAELTFCVFDSEKVTDVDINFLMNEVKAIQGETNVNVVRDVADDYDDVLIVSESFQ